MKVSLSDLLEVIKLTANNNTVYRAKAVNMRVGVKVRDCYLSVFN
jgi:hypothetical protein